MRDIAFHHYTFPDFTVVGQRISSVNGISTHFMGPGRWGYERSIRGVVVQRTVGFMSNLEAQLAMDKADRNTLYGRDNYQLVRVWARPRE